jgi:hypothetical protein
MGLKKFKEPTQNASSLKNLKNWEEELDYIWFLIIN